jgi:DNA segregation ATPase FtsK/SpoIIIE-like protein
MIDDELLKQIEKLIDSKLEAERARNLVLARDIANMVLKSIPSAVDYDSQLEEAIRLVCLYDRASASLLQRKLSIGYSRASKILDKLEELKVVGPTEGAEPRKVLIRDPNETIEKLHNKVTTEN